MHNFDYSGSSKIWLWDDLSIHSSKNELFHIPEKDDHSCYPCSYNLNRNEQYLEERNIYSIDQIPAFLEMLVTKIINAIVSIFQSMIGFFCQKRPQLINVPDDGNCLFYAIGIGLKKNYPEDEEIQRKLNWEVDPNSLKGDLFKAYELLAAPGKQLREQAAQYLIEQSKLCEKERDESIFFSLVDGIGSHIETVKKKIIDDKSVILILDGHLEELRKNNSSNEEITQQIKEKEIHKKSIEESIKLQEENLPKDEQDLERYIALTEKNHFYCGIVQVLSLCKIYDIPIKVIYKYGEKEQQYEEVYNKNSKRKVLTLAHVNNNHFHFQYFESTDK